MKTTVSEGVDMDSIEQIIKNTTEENQSKTDWTKAWSTKYPILKIYQNEVDIPLYAGQIREMSLIFRTVTGTANSTPCWC